MLQKHRRLCVSAMSARTSLAGHVVDALMTLQKPQLEKITVIPIAPSGALA